MSRTARLRPGHALLWAVLPALSALSLLGTVLAPRLAVANPLLLAALAPRYPFLLLAARRTPALLFAVVAFARLSAADAPSFLLARRHGHVLRSVVSRRRWTRAVDAALCAWFGRLGMVLVACWPTSKVLAVAGASSVPGRRVALASMAGTAGQVVFLYGAGNVARSIGL